MNKELTLEEANKIRNWDISDAFGLIDYVCSLWCYGGKYRWKQWDYDLILKSDILNVELHTGGLSYHEDIIEALLLNDMFNTMCYDKWQRGGHYYFVLTPEQFGYKKVSEYCKEKGISRQAVHKDKTKYSWVIASKKKQFIRPIKK